MLTITMPFNGGSGQFFLCVFIAILPLYKERTHLSILLNEEVLFIFNSSSVVSEAFLASSRYWAWEWLVYVD